MPVAPLTWTTPLTHSSVLVWGGIWTEDPDAPNPGPTSSTLALTRPYASTVALDDPYGSAIGLTDRYASTLEIQT